MNIEIKEKLAHKHSGQYYKTKKGVSKEGKNDDYSTPNEAWDEIIQFLPNKKAKIYEPFYLDGGSGNYLKSQGLNIIHENMDFYENAKLINYDFILSNPPFANCKRLFAYLAELDKPFMLLLPTLKIHTNYLASFFEGKRTQIIIPRRRIHFQKWMNNEKVENWKKGTAFDCIWFCYKMGFEKDIQYSQDFGCSVKTNFKLENKKIKKKKINIIK
jgi:hypothetical protein|tara:strand:+ start:12149 stop:12793 length:645 start_codon:yes stop_codon:yes gene_type:complete